MTSSQFRLSRPIYFVIVVVVTELILVIGAVLILLPTGFLNQLPLDVLGFLLFFKTIIAIIALIIAGNIQPLQSRVLVSRGAGFLLGRIVGLLLGGILGGRYGGLFLGILGLVGGSFLIGRVGARISYVIGIQLEKLFPSGEKAD